MPSGLKVGTNQLEIFLNHLGLGTTAWAKPSDALFRESSDVGNDRFQHARPFYRLKPERVELYDHRARWYDRTTRRFLSPDPLGPVDSPNLYQAFLFDGGSVRDPYGFQSVFEFQLDEQAGLPVDSPRRHNLERLHEATSQQALVVLSNPRVQGGLMVVGGCAEAVAGGALATGGSATVVAVPAGLYLVAAGTDTCTTGAIMLWSGQRELQLRERALVQAGLSESSAGLLVAGADIAAGGSAGLLARGGRLSGRASSAAAGVRRTGRGVYAGRHRFDATNLSAQQVDRAILKSIRRASGARGNAAHEIVATPDQMQDILQKTAVWRRNVHAARPGMATLSPELKGTFLHSSVQRRIRSLNVQGLAVNHRLYGTSRYTSPATGLPYEYRIPDFRIGSTIFDIKPAGTPLSGPQYIDFMSFGGTRDVRWIPYVGY